MALSGEALFLTTYENVYVIDRRSGEILGESTLGKGRPTSPAVVGDLLYFCKGSYHDSPPRLYAADAKTARKRWVLELDDDPAGSVAVTANAAYVGDTAGTLRAVDRVDGNERWSTSVGGSIAASPAVSNGRSFVATHEGHVLSISNRDGSTEWRTKIGPGVSNAGGLALTERAVYLGADDGLHVFDIQSGDELWQFQTRASATAPTVANGVVYFGTTLDSRYLRAVDVRSRNERWKHRVPKVQEGDTLSGGIRDAPVVVDDAVYVVTANRRLYAFGKMK